MATSLLDQREINQLLRLHIQVACVTIVILAFLVNWQVATSAALSYGWFVITWTLSAYYTFRFRGAQQIKAILLGFYIGAGLKLLLTVLWVGLLMRYWPMVNWLVFLLVMLQSYLVSLVGGFNYYRSDCG